MIQPIPAPPGYTVIQISPEDEDDDTVDKVIVNEWPVLAFAYSDADDLTTYLEPLTVVPLNDPMFSDISGLLLPDGRVVHIAEPTEVRASRDEFIEHAKALLRYHKTQKPTVA